MGGGTGEEAVRDTASTIANRIASALDAQSLIMVTAVIKAGEDHAAAHATEEAAFDYLNMLQASAVTMNQASVGPVTAAEIVLRIGNDVATIERTMPA